MRSLLKKIKKLFSKDPEPSCLYCERFLVREALPADLGRWIMLPSEARQEEEFLLTCADCTYYGQVYGIMRDGTLLRCAGFDMNAPLPKDCENFDFMVVPMTWMPDGYTGLVQEEYDA